MDRLEGMVEVESPLGRVRGRRRGGVITFAGVPYAEPPTGERRFQAPTPVQPWSDVLDATSPSVIAPQLASRLLGVMGDFERAQSEDCLHVTITTPAVDDARRPVVVWLHGGGFSSGSGGLDWYDGSLLSEEGDVVVVGVNYRLGALGYLFADDIASGNLGLLDQALALRFIRSNIAAFGGDPDRLTLMGQSAGGNSILALYAGRHVPPGVQRVILQSAALGMAPQRPDVARAIGQAFLDEVGIAPDEPDARSRAATASVEAVLQAQGTVARAGARYGDTAPPFQLVLANGIPSDTSFHLAAADRMGGVNVLLGSTLDEAEAFLATHPRTAGLTHDEARALALEVYGRVGQAGYASLRERFPRHSAGTLFSRLTSDEVFVRPAQEFAVRLLEGGASVHLFDFAFRPKGSMFGACHCLELPFVFGPTDAWSSAPMLSGGDPETVERLSAAIRAAWISFVRTGKPASPVLPEWPAASPGNLVSMRLDEQPCLQVYGSHDG